jgi:hypothetical protein
LPILASDEPTRYVFCARAAQAEARIPIARSITRFFDSEYFQLICPCWM